MKGHEHPVNFINKLVTHPWFKDLVMYVVLGNTVVLAVQWPNMSEKLENQLDFANFIFTFIFIGEMILMVIGLGPKEYEFVFT